MEELGTVLYGMMGSGKSPLGEALGQELGQPFVDTDELIERFAGRTCADIIADPVANFAGEQATAILNYAPTSPEVVATGGSVATYPELTRHLGKFGVGIFIKVPTVDLFERLSTERIAALNNPDNLPFDELYAQRIPKYEAAAQYTLEVAPRETLEESIARLIALRRSISAN